MKSILVALAVVFAAVSGVFAAQVGQTHGVQIVCEHRESVEAMGRAMFEDKAYSRAQTMLRAYAEKGECLVLPQAYPLELEEVGEVYAFIDTDGDPMLWTVARVRNLWTLVAELSPTS